MIPEPIRELLDELYERYDTPGFIEDDPISVPHGFTRREDIEIAGFLAATIAWGNRRSIVRNGRKLMKLMDRSPYDFTMNASRNELLPLLDFVHRTFNGGDCIDFIGALRGICLATARWAAISSGNTPKRATCGPCCRAFARPFGARITAREPRSTSRRSTGAPRASVCACISNGWSATTDGA